jgi:sugar phosphate permease
MIPGNIPLSEQRSSQPYVVATAFFSLFAIVGFALYGLPLFYDFFMKEFGWSRTVVTSGNALGKLLVAPMFGFIAGWLIDRHGPRKMLMIGALMTGIALIGLSIMNSLGMFYIFYLLNALGYVFGGPLPCQVLISRWFTSNRGKAMGIAYLGIGTGGFLVPLIVKTLEKNIGWHLSLTTLGLLIILIALPMAFFIKDSAGNRKAEMKQSEYVPMKTILGKRNFYLLALGSMCSIGAVGGMIAHLKLYMIDLEFSQAQALNVMSFVLFMSLVGRVLMGVLADILKRKYVMMTIFVIVGLSIPLLLLPEFQGRIYIFAAIFGIGLGGDYMIIPLMAGDLFGIRTLGRVMGIILVADGLAEALVPMLVSVTFDTTGNYSFGFSILITIAMAGVMIISFIKQGSEIKEVAV